MEYWKEIESGRVPVSDKVYRTYKKIVWDLEHPGDFLYSEKRAEHIITFFEKYCRHSKGKWGGAPVKLEPWEKAHLATVCGFVDTNGLRKYTKAVLIVGKKNGKSLLASGVGLYLQVADGEAGPEVYAAATKKDQAKIIWNESKRMVKKSPALRSRIKCLVGELSSEDFNEGTFKPLSSDVNTMDGLNVHGALMDEIHQWQNGLDLYNIIADGTSARDQPLIYETSTAGTIREDFFDHEYDEAERVINGYFDPNGYHDEHSIYFVYELDKRSEWTDPKAWIKANPNLGVTKKESILASKVERAKNNPIAIKNLVCKEFNIRETDTESWLSFDELNNTATYDIGKLKPRYGLGGVDLSSSVDLTAACVIFKVPKDDHVYSMNMFWLPEALMEQKIKEDKIPYDLWQEQGLVATCPGNKIHYKYVVEWFKKVQSMGIMLQHIGYDDWSAQYFVEDMKNTFGEEVMESVKQGTKTLSSPMKTLGADLAVKIVNYNNNPILKWNLANTRVKIDKNNNIQPDKGKNPTKRIDGTAALLDAYVELERHLEEYMVMI
jgi:phage terminase large subunit-like protein